MLALRSMAAVEVVRAGLYASQRSSDCAPALLGPRARPAANSPSAATLTAGNTQAQLSHVCPGRALIGQEGAVSRWQHIDSQQHLAPAQRCTATGRAGSGTLCRPSSTAHLCGEVVAVALQPGCCHVPVRLQHR